MKLCANIAAVLTMLSKSDLNANLIRENNGVFLLASLTLPAAAADRNAASYSMQCNAFRALRFLYSVERNRRFKFFKMLFPPDLMELFLQVPHFCIDLTKYSVLTESVAGTPAPTYHLSSPRFTKAGLAERTVFGTRASDHRAPPCHHRCLLLLPPPPPPLPLPAAAAAAAAAHCRFVNDLASAKVDEYTARVRQADINRAPEKRIQDPVSKECV